MKFFKSAVKPYVGEQVLIEIKVLCPPDPKFQDSITKVFKIYQQEGFKSAGIEVLSIKTMPYIKENNTNTIDTKEKGIKG